jgi:hypothetical protein
MIELATTQFRRVANVYFTMVAVLSCTEMSPVSYYTTIPPLVRHAPPFLFSWNRRRGCPLVQRPLSSTREATL